MKGGTAKPLISTTETGIRNGKCQIGLFARAAPINPGGASRLPDDAIVVGTYAELDRYLRKFAEGALDLVLLLGPPGIGKTEAVKEVLGIEPEGTSRTLYVEGHMQPFGLYQGLWLHRNRPVVMLYPPLQAADQSRQPMEMVFLVDVSGSMNGRPIAKAKEAVRAAMSRLDQRDTFQILAFDNRVTPLTAHPVPATPENVTHFLAGLDKFNGGGGTEMLKGIQAAIACESTPGKHRLITLLTDGYIGNEADVVRQIAQHRGATRFCSIGIGSSPNRMLIDGVGKAGAGAIAYVGLNDQVDHTMQAYVDRVCHPALTDIQIDWGGMDAVDIYPAKISDLYVGRPVIITGRYTHAPTRPIQITGYLAGKSVTYQAQPEEVAPNASAPAPAAAALPAVWARAKIADICDGITYGYARPDDSVSHIKSLAIAYQLMSQFTAFVAVDSARRTESDHGTTIPVPVPVPTPEGVKYETTVDGGKEK